MTSQRKNQKTLPYFKDVSGKYVCSICRSEYTCQSNVCRHYKKHHPEDDNEEKSIFTYKGKLINKSTERILIWKCCHGIPMAALSDCLLTDLLPPSTLKSAKTNQNILNDMCQQIVDFNYLKAREKSVSLILDGGTVNHTKWLAVGFMHRTLENNKFQVLDVRVFEKTTSNDIKYQIEQISDKIQKKANGKVVAACTDNAQNFRKIFLDDDLVLDDFIPLSMVRVSCSCHTIQLALKDLKNVDNYYSNLIEKIKVIPTKISFLSKADIKRLNIASFPPLQKQRWNSVFITLSYIISNVGAISSLFNINEIGFFNMFDLLQLQKELRPIYEFTIKCETDNFNQANVFIEFRALESKLEVLNTKRSKKLLSLIRKRFSITADIEISKLCYFTTNAGINEKRERFPHIPLSAIDTSDEESKRKFDNEMKFIHSFEKTIQKIYAKMKLDFKTVLTAFDIMMKHYVPANDEIHQFPSPQELKSLISEYSSNETMYIDLAKFIDLLQVLPSSEAGAERVFARMRDIFHKKQTRLSPESLRTNLIVSFYVDQEMPKEYFDRIGNWPDNQKEELDEEEEIMENDEYE